jgi:hypothetical protein
MNLISAVTAGLDPAIHSVTIPTFSKGSGMDATVKPRHDDILRGAEGHP